MNANRVVNTDRWDIQCCHNHCQCCHNHWQSQLAMLSQSLPKLPQWIGTHSYQCCHNWITAKVATIIAKELQTSEYIAWYWILEQQYAVDILDDVQSKVYQGTSCSLQKGSQLPSRRWASAAACQQMRPILFVEPSHPKLEYNLIFWLGAENLKKPVNSNKTNSSIELPKVKLEEK